MGNIEIKAEVTLDGLEYEVGKQHYVTEIIDPRFGIKVKGMAYGKGESLTNAIDEYVLARRKQQMKSRRCTAENA